MADTYILDSTTSFQLEYEGIIIATIEPQKFDSATLVIERDPEFMGFITQFLEDNLKLLFDDAWDEIIENPQFNAAALLRARFYDEGIDSQVDFVILKGGIELFRAQIDFTSFEDTEEGISATVERTSFEDLVRTRFDLITDYRSTETIDGEATTAGEVIDVLLHSKGILKTFQSQQDTIEVIGDFLISDEQSPTFTDQSFLQFGGFDNEKFNEIEEKFTFPWLVSDFYKNSNQNFSDYNPLPFPSELILVTEAGAYNLTYNLDLTVNITNSQIATNTVPINASFQIVVIDENGIEKSQNTLGSGNVNIPITQTTGSFSIINSGILDLGELAVADRIFIFINWRTGGGGAVIIDINAEIIANEGNILTLTGLTTTPATNCKTVLPFEAWEETLKRLTGQTGKLRSSIFGRTDTTPAEIINGDASQIVISNGYNIRQFPLLERSLFFSLADLWDTFKATHGIGMGFEEEAGEDILRVEKRAYFFQDVEILAIENPSNYKIEPATNYIFNEVAQGYEKFADEQVNNLDEFNSEQTRVTGVKSIKKKFQNLAKYIASGYLLEFARRKTYSTSSTEDTDQDEDNFLISCNQKYAEDEEVTLTGVQVLIFGVELTVKSRFIAKEGTDITISGGTTFDGTYTVLVESFELSNGDYRAIISPAGGSGFFQTGNLTYISKAEYEPEKDEVLTSVNNVISPETSYNFRLSPLRCFIRSLDFIKASSIYKPVNHLLRFVKGNLNFILETDWQTSDPFGEYAEPLTENENINQDDFINPIFLPEKHSFDTDLTPDDFLLLKRAHTGNETGLNYGYIRATDHNGIENKLFILSLKYEPETGNAKIEALKKYEL